jgi:gamma-glutamyltranspeptidase
VLAEGGNAIEAMVAMAATIAVVYPHMNAIGGDGFWLVHEPGGKVHAIEACGPAGALATIERYREKGHDTIPARGPDAADDGRRRDRRLADGAGARKGASAAGCRSRTCWRCDPHCDAGYAISTSELRTWPQQVEAAKLAPGFSEFFWPGGEQPKAGARRKPEALGAMFKQLVDAGLDDFYRGDVGREIAADLAGSTRRSRARTWRPTRRASSSRSRCGCRVWPSTTSRRRRRGSPRW